MKYISIKKIGIGIVALLAIVSCTKNFEGINTDPNRVTDASNGALMVYVQRTAAYQYLTGGGSPNTWSQYSADKDAANTFISFDPGGSYTTLYHDILYQLEQIILTSEIEENNSGRHYVAMAEIMKVWTMAIGVELWGDMPFFDALQGGTYEGGIEEEYIRPKFDDDEAIYKYLIEKLDEINTFMLESESLTDIISVGSYDIYAGGNMALWRKFANSLQAKLLLRMSSADETYAMAGLETLFADPDLYPMFENSKEAMGIKWQGFGADGGNISGIAYTLYNNGNYEGIAGLLNNGYVRMLAELKDPRRFTILQRPKAVDKSTFTPLENDSIQIGDYIYNFDTLNVMTGFPPARHENTADRILRPSTKYYTSIGGGFANIHRTDFIMDYVELCFVKAEAKLKGVTSLTEDVNTYYEAGIRASFEYLKKIHGYAIEDELLFTNTTFQIDPDDIYAEDSILNYLAQTNVLLQGDVDGDFEKIITQRYMANFYNGLNAFSMIRRTGLPKLDYFAIGTNADLGFPTRYEYPEQVAITNGDNLIDAIGKLFNNIFDGKLWLFENCPDPQPAFDEPVLDYVIYDIYSCEKIYPAE